jgi:plastocyanin
MIQTNNQNHNGNETFMKTGDFNLECHPHRYLDIL